MSISRSFAVMPASVFSNRTSWEPPSSVKALRTGRPMFENCLLTTIIFDLFFSSFFLLLQANNLYNFALLDVGPLCTFNGPSPLKPPLSFVQDKPLHGSKRLTACTAETPHRLFSARPKFFKWWICCWKIGNCLVAALIPMMHATKRCVGHGWAYWTTWLCLKTKVWKSLGENRKTHLIS